MGISYIRGVLFFSKEITGQGLTNYEIKQRDMRNSLLTIAGLICLAGFALQGVFGLAAGIWISAIGGIVYGSLKRDKLVLRYALLALVIYLAGITAFYIASKVSNR